MTKTPQERVAVVTGGTGGLGRAVVDRFVASGHKLGVTYIVPDEATKFEDELNLGDDRLILRRVDATDPEAMNDFMKDVAARFGGIHIACALVGGWAGGRDIEETDDVRFERMIDLNLRSAFYTVRAALPHLRESGWGRIVVVGSRAAYDTPAGQGAYNIAKAGVVALAKSVAQELDTLDITVNAILPALIDTAATRKAMPYAEYVNFPKPEEIAAVIEFLTSEAAAVMNGIAVPVYGGA